MTPLGFSKLEILGGNGKPAIDHFLGQPLVFAGSEICEHPDEQMFHLSPARA